MEDTNSEMVNRWLDYLKFNVQNRLRNITIKTVWAIAMAGSSYFLYSILYNIYYTNLWVNSIIMLLLILNIVEIGFFGFLLRKLMEIRENIQKNKFEFKRALGQTLIHSYTSLFGLWLIALIIVFFLFNTYLTFVFLLLPLHFCIRHFCVNINQILVNMIKSRLIDGLIKDTLVKGDNAKATDIFCRTKEDRRCK